MKIDFGYVSFQHSEAFDRVSCLSTALFI